MANLKAKLRSMPIFIIFDADAQKRMLAQKNDVLSKLIDYLEEQTPSWQKSRDNLQNAIKEAPHQFQREVSKLMHKVEENDKKVQVHQAETQIDQYLNS